MKTMIGGGWYTKYPKLKKSAMKQRVVQKQRVWPSEHGAPGTPTFATELYKLVNISSMIDDVKKDVLILIYKEAGNTRKNAMYRWCQKAYNMKLKTKCMRIGDVYSPAEKRNKRRCHFVDTKRGCYHGKKCRFGH